MKILASGFQARQVPGERGRERAHCFAIWNVVRPAGLRFQVRARKSSRLSSAVKCARGFCDGDLLSLFVLWFQSGVYRRARRRERSRMDLSYLTLSMPIALWFVLSSCPTRSRGCKRYRVVQGPVKSSVGCTRMHVIRRNPKQICLVFSYRWTSRRFGRLAQDLYLRSVVNLYRWRG